MRRAHVVLMLGCTLIAAAAGAGCAKQPQADYEQVRGHLLAATDAMTAARSTYSSCTVDLNTVEASEVVAAAYRKASVETSRAGAGLSAARQHLASAGNDPSWAKWDAALGEGEQLYQAHQELETALWAGKRQLVTTGLLEMEIPATEGDVASAFMGAAAGQPDMIRFSTKIAGDNYRRMRAEALAADRLEPGAHIDRIADYCSAQLKAVALLEQAASALERGDQAQAKRLVNKADTLTSNSADMPKPAIWEVGYADRLKPLSKHWDAHLAEFARLAKLATQ